MILAPSIFEEHGDAHGRQTAMQKGRRTAKKIWGLVGTSFSQNPGGEEEKYSYEDILFRVLKRPVLLEG